MEDPDRDPPMFTADDLIEAVLWIVLFACLAFVLCLSAGYAWTRWIT